MDDDIMLPSRAGAGLFRRAAVLSCGALLLAAVAAWIPGGPAAAQDSDAAQPTWPSTCRGETADPEQIVCTVAQRIFGAEGEVLFNIAFQKQGWRDDVLLNIRTPLSLHLPNGLTYAVDGAPLQSLDYERCTRDGCNVFTVVPADAMDRLLSGALLQITVWRDAERSETLDIPLTRFAENWNSLGL